MAVELMRKQIELSDMLEQEVVQMVKERDIIVPDGKPDIQSIMYLDGKIKMDQMDTQEGRVVYKGQVELKIVYIPENNPNCVCKIKGTIPLEDFVIMESVTPDKGVELDYEIEHLHWSISNERKLNVKAIIKLTVTVSGEKEVEIVTQAMNEPGMQVQTKTMQLVKPMNKGIDEFPIKDELTIPQGKSSVQDILNVSGRVKEEQVKRIEDEMIYSGMVEVSVMYSGQDEVSKVEVMKQNIPFNYAIRVPKTDHELYWDYDVTVEPTYVQVTPDYDGEDRVIDIECMMKMSYTTYDQMEELVLDDVYCPGKKAKMKQNKQKYMNMVGKEDIKIPKKETITMDYGLEDVDHIFSVDLKPMVEEKGIADDKLTINGMLEMKMVYTTPENTNQIQTMVEMLPFSEQLQIPGMTQDSIVNVSVKPKNVNVSLYNKNDMMLEYIMDYMVEAYDEEEMSIVESVEMMDLSAEEINGAPSITVYVVKKGDTLWNLAKKYNTTVQDIAEINDLEHDGALQVGQKLIILKRTNTEIN